MSVLGRLSRWACEHGWHSPVWERCDLDIRSAWPFMEGYCRRCGTTVYWTPPEGP